MSPRISPEAQFLIALARLSTAAVFAAVDSWAPPQELHMQSKAKRAGGRRKKKLPSKQARLVASRGAFFLRFFWKLEAEKDPPPHGSRCSGGSRGEVSHRCGSGASREVLLKTTVKGSGKRYEAACGEEGASMTKEGRDSDAEARFLARLLPHYPGLPPPA